MPEITVLAFLTISEGIMEVLNNLLAGFKTNLPSYIILILFLIILYGLNAVIGRRLNRQSTSRFRSQVASIIIFFIGLIGIIIILPLGDHIQGQLLSLIGLLLSAAIALSSTTLVGNAMAGFMLRSVRNFRSGDFINVGGHFGRVSERGLFHVEIQTEDSDLTTLPNIFLITNPVKVIRSEGTIISAEVSLGYDLPHGQIEKLLTSAAEETELENPFVQIVNLGDFSVTYRAAGMTTDVKKLLSTRSRLRQNMLDKLHGDGVEIVSPTFMNTRALGDTRQFIPRPIREQAAEGDKTPPPERIVFEKADAAESLDNLRQQVEDAAKEIEALKKQTGEEKDTNACAKLEGQIEFLNLRRERLTEIIKAREENEKGK